MTVGSPGLIGAAFWCAATARPGTGTAERGFEAGLAELARSALSTITTDAGAAEFGAARTCGMRAGLEVRTALAGFSGETPAVGAFAGGVRPALTAFTRCEGTAGCETAFAVTTWCGAAFTAWDKRAAFATFAWGEGTAGCETAFTVTAWGERATLATLAGDEWTAFAALARGERTAWCETAFTFTTWREGATLATLVRCERAAFPTLARCEGATLAALARGEAAAITAGCVRATLAAFAWGEATAIATR